VIRIVLKKFVDGPTGADLRDDRSHGDRQTANARLAARDLSEGTQAPGFRRTEPRVDPLPLREPLEGEVGGARRATPGEGSNNKTIPHRHLSNTRAIGTARRQEVPSATGIASPRPCASPAAAPKRSFPGWALRRAF
jgi:hypothetical protein